MLHTSVGFGRDRTIACRSNLYRMIMCVEKLAVELKKFIRNENEYTKVVDGIGRRRTCSNMITGS